VTHQEVAYPVVADASHAASYDIYSIDSVNLVRRTQMRSRVIEFQPISRSATAMIHGDGKVRPVPMTTRHDEFDDDLLQHY